MKFLQSLYPIYESSDLDKLPEDVLSEIKRNILAGAKDLDQKWGNSLELVHKAYLVTGVQRPTPDLKSAWIDYETMLQYGVEQLANHRGMDGDWRMSSAVFHEALERKFKFRVVELGGNHGKSHDVEAKSMQDIIDGVKKSTTDGHDMKIIKSKDKENPNGVTLSFSKWGIRNNYQVRITQIT